MSSFYACVCKHGHVAIGYKRVSPGEQCGECGADMIDTCPQCGELIKKWHYYGSVVMGPKEFEPPDTCRHCGAVFPWKTPASLEPDSSVRQDENKIK